MKALALEETMSLQRTLLLGGFIAVSVLLVSRLSKRFDDLRAALRVDAADLDVGKVWLCESIAHKLRLYNTSPNRIVVSGFETSCGCTAVAPSSLTIEPGGKQTVDVTINLAQVVRSDLHRNHWPLSVHITPISTDRSARQRWRLRGLIDLPLEAIPQPSVGHLYISRIDEPSAVTFPVHLKDGIRIDRVSPQTPGVTCAVRLGHGRNAIVDLWVDPSKIEVGPGIAQAHLHLQHSSGGIPPFPLEVLVSIKPLVVAEPPVLLLHEVDSLRTVNLKSVCGRRFKVTRVRSLHGVITELAPPGGVYVDVQTISVRPLTNDETMALSRLEVEVALEGTGRLEEIPLLVQLPARQPGCR